MKVSVRIEMADGSTRTVRVTPLAIIGWERATHRKLSDLGEGIGMEEIARLAWEQERLANVNGDVPDNLDAWLLNVTDLTPETEDSPPTQGAASPAPA